MFLAKPAHKEPKQKPRKGSLSNMPPRSHSAPVEMEAQNKSFDDLDLVQKLKTRLPSLVWTYVQMAQGLLITRGKNFQGYVKQASFTSLSSRIKHKYHKFIHNIKILKRMFSYLLDQKVIIVLAYLSMTLTSLAQTKLPQIVGSMIDKAVVAHDSNELTDQAKLFLAVAIAYSVSEFFWAHLFNILSQQIRWTMKHQIYSSLLRREVEYFERRPLTEILDSVNGLVVYVEPLCTNHFSSMGRNLIQFFYCTYMLTAISYKLTVLLIVMIPLHFIIPMIYTKFNLKIVGNEGFLNFQTERRVMETFQNIKIVKAFSTEDSEISNYQGLLQKNAKATMKASITGSAYMAFSGFYTNLTLLSIVYIGMTLVNKGEVSPGTLSSFLLFSMAISTSFRDASFSYLQIKEKIPACERLFNIIDENGKIPYKGGKVLKNFEGKIALNNVCFSYPVAPDVPVLKNISLDIKPGDSIAFVGMSGGGKSTIISLLLRFYDTNEGSVTLDGVDLREIDLKWLHNQIGYVSQDPILFSGTIEDNITYGMKEYSQEALVKAIEMANAHFIFNKDLFPNGLKHDIGERGNSLSGGQKQRLAIARALMRQPKILIFDEATSNLDANAEYEVQKAIDNLISSSQITVVTIAHRLSTIMKCNVIFVLKNGMVVEKGNHAELVERDGVYKTLVQRQFQTAH